MKIIESTFEDKLKDGNLIHYYHICQITRIHIDTNNNCIQIDFYYKFKPKTG